MTRAAAMVCALALAACSIHLREAIPDADTAVASAVKLCNWQASEHLHAELQGQRWHVWDDRGNAQAFLNRYDTRGTYFCVGL